MGTIDTSIFQALKFNNGENVSFRKRYIHYINLLLTYIISIVLILSGISKIIDPKPLINNLTAAFGFLPEAAVILISTILPLIEIGLGLLLIFSLYKEKLKSKRNIILLATIFLFGLFLAYGIYGYIIGLKNDCGCFGNVVKSSFGWGMMIRDLVFLILSIFILINNPPKAGGFSKFSPL
jgi:Methylamine utilisation protein MauE